MHLISHIVLHSICHKEDAAGYEDEVEAGVSIGAGGTDGVGHL